MRKFDSREIKDFVAGPKFDETTASGADGSWPKITVVTPSYNQAAFLEITILSILNQNYPNLELIVVDGGSKDGSVEIINRYSRYIAWWVSEEDAGQSDAINKGFAKATGDLVAWQNSDDIYLPGALERVAKEFRSHSGFDVYFGNMYTIDRDGNIIHELRYTPFSLYSLLYDGWNITNQSAFFHSRVVKEYVFDRNYTYAMDGDFFVRMGKDNRKFKFIHEPLGALRIHSDAKGERISRTIGVEEWVTIRGSAGIEMRGDIPWGRQHRLKKAYCKLRKLFYYFIQGDIDYIANKARKMISG